MIRMYKTTLLESFNTQPRGGGCQATRTGAEVTLPFQHTAARRRLLAILAIFVHFFNGFNTQPRGGGCVQPSSIVCHIALFQHTAARRRLRTGNSQIKLLRVVSTHSRAEAAARKL